MSNFVRSSGPGDSHLENLFCFHFLRCVRLAYRDLPRIKTSPSKIKTGMAFVETSVRYVDSLVVGLGFRRNVCVFFHRRTFVRLPTRCNHFRSENPNLKDNQNYPTNDFRKATWNFEVIFSSWNIHSASPFTGIDVLIAVKSFLL